MISYQVPQDLKQYLPSPEPNPDVKDYGDRIGMSTEIDDYLFLEQKDYAVSKIKYEWRRMYHVITMHIADMFIGRDLYWVVKMYPLVIKHYAPNPSMELRLMADVNVAQTNKFYVPEFIPISNKEKIEYLEWKCGGCSTVNPIKNRVCDHCGYPRTLLMQEILREEGVW